MPGPILEATWRSTTNRSSETRSSPPCATTAGQRAARPNYRPELGLDTHQLFTFIGATQADEWADLVTYYGGDPNDAQRGFAERLDQAIATDGLLDVLRKGVKDRGVRIRLAYFEPSFVESDAILADYLQQCAGVAP